MTRTPPSPPASRPSSSPASTGGDTSSRGPLFPQRLPTAFSRHPATGSTRELVQWFWVSQWDLPAGEVRHLPLLAFPASNLVVETGLVGFSGPSTRVSHRDLVGNGWAVAALLRPAAAAALADRVPGELTSLRDDYRPLALPHLHHAVATAVADGGAEPAVAVLADWLANELGEPDPDALLANRMAELVGADATVRTVGDIAQRLAISERSVHRLALRHVGLTPYAMIRRRRLQEAAQRVRDHPGTPLAEVAADLDFTDQAHLAREFREVLGFSPSDYRASLATDAPQGRGDAGATGDAPGQ